MSKKKRSFSPDFKTKIVLELLAGDKTLSRIAGKYEVTSSPIRASFTAISTSYINLSRFFNPK